MSTEAEIATAVAGETVKIAFSGSVAVLRVAGKAAAHAAALLAAVVTDKRQKYGRMRLQDMIKDGVSLVTIKTEDKDTFREAMKFYGMKYCLVRDKKNDNGTIDIFIRTMDAPVINRAMEKYNLAVVKQDVDVQLKKEHVLDASVISISKAELVIDETEDKIQTIVPYTAGDNIRYLYFDKAQVAEVNNGKSYMTQIDKAAEYEIFDKDGQKEIITGDKLLSYYKSMEEDRIKNSASLTGEEAQLGKDSKEQFKEGDITITRSKNSLVIEENKDEIRTRIPGTYGSGERHVYFDKSEVKEVYGGKSFKVHIDEERHYTIYDKDGKVSGTLTGKQLLGHYDSLKDPKVIPIRKTRPSVKEHMKTLENRDKAKTNSFNNYQQREYDFNELEKKLLNRKDEPKLPD